MKMSENLLQLISSCVVRNIQIKGNTPAMYTIQQVVNDMKLDTLKSIARKYAKIVQNTAQDEALFDSDNSRKSTIEVDNEIVLKTLVALVNFKEAKAKAVAEAKAVKQAKSERLQTLKALRVEKEMENLKGKSLDKLDKMIDDLEKENVVSVK